MVSKSVIVLAVVCVAAAAAYLAGGTLTGSSTLDLDNNEIIAKQLAAAGVVMYGSSDCGACIRQKNEFGEAFKYINFVDCKQDKSLCSDITQYPTWKINGKMITEIYTPEELARLIQKS